MTDPLLATGAGLIRAGDTGPDVRDLQQRLARVVDDPPPVDGVFDDSTRSATRAFQRARGLPADGIVGPETWRALVEAGYRLGDRLLWHSRNPMRGDDVRELQHRLNQLGFDAGAEDGIFGPLAQAAVEDFQRNIGLAVDGVAGSETLGTLLRLHRDHQSGGVGVRVREREALRQLARRGLTGARVLIDPTHGPADPGHLGAEGITEQEVAWSVATRLAGRLAALGAEATLSRGPATTPSGSTRARLANELGVDIVVSIGVNALDNPVATGASTYYFGTDRFVSETGRRLAELVQDAMVAGGWAPDCRCHRMTWAILRETRMPAVVAEPGFLTSPQDEERFCDPLAMDRLAEAIAGGVARFFEPLAVTPPAQLQVGVAG